MSGLVLSRRPSSGADSPPRSATDRTGLDELLLFATPKLNNPEKKEKNKKRTDGMGSKEPGSDICKRGNKSVPTDGFYLRDHLPYPMPGILARSANLHNTSHPTARVLRHQRLPLNLPCPDFETRRGVTVVRIGDRRIETAERASWIHRPLHTLLCFALPNTATWSFTWIRRGLACPCSWTPCYPHPVHPDVKSSSPLPSPSSKANQAQIRY
ncbi:hypothetical protein N7510_008514 [Penicillium lagena]|uniref:uncharacterized protein n=1 Tax=Penicillium lagena TaxID=94218 RepID=UPI002541E855|nr:uncharacterized protein N7510_008514 [Penicillium lagena]KAJ5605733.1 hypothetical protein N7510_008514 [Penicillium lagena]